MNVDQRISAVVVGLQNPAAADTVGATHDRLAELLGVGGDFTTEPGVKLGLADAFPDAECFENPVVAETIRSYRAYVAESFNAETRSSFPWLDYVLCRFAAAGSKSDLLELVRIVKHRDGSTAAIEVGGAAAEILRGALDQAPELAARLKTVGLDLDAIPFGGFPHALDVVAAPAAPVLMRKPPRPFGRRIPASPPANASAAAESGVTVHPAGDLVEIPRKYAGVDFPKSVERDGACIEVLGTLFSIKAAAELADSITDLVAVMLLPGPGFRWEEGFGDGTDSALIFSDGRAPELLTAVVRTEAEGYRAKIFGFGAPPEGVALGGWFTSLADAKFHAAEFIRLASKQNEA